MLQVRELTGEKKQPKLNELVLYIPLKKKKEKKKKLNYLNKKARLLRN